MHNLFVYMHTIKYHEFIDLSYYPVSFKPRVFEKLRNSTYFIHKTTTTLIAVSDCLISLLGIAKFD